MIRGFDVSHWQGVENWATLKAQHGISFGFVKATESNNYVDPTLDNHWGAIRSAGLVRGAYHFARPAASSAIVQADWFVDAVNRVGGFTGSDLPIMDFETSGGLGTNAGLEWCIQWANRVSVRTAKIPFIYFGSWAADDARTSDLRDHYCGWWYPRYPASWADRAAWPDSYASLVQPNPNRWGESPDMWQFSSSFPAGGEAHDANVSPLSLPQLQTLNQRTANGKATDMPLTPQEIDAVGASSADKTSHWTLQKTTPPEVDAGGGTIGWATAAENTRRWAWMASTKIDALALALAGLTAKVDALVTAGPADVDEAAIVAGLTPVLQGLSNLSEETLQNIASAVSDELNARLANG